MQQDKSVAGRGCGAQNVELDPILKELVQFGPYQRLVYGLLLLVVMFNAMFTLSYAFTAGSVDHRCRISECETRGNRDYFPSWLGPNMTKGQCERYAPIDFYDYTTNDTDLGDFCDISNFDPRTTIMCNEWIYKDHQTILSEFDLGCAEWKRTLVGTLHNVGQFICLLLTGIVSDRYGRRVALLLVLGSSVCGFLRSFATGYWMFIGLEILDATFGSGVYSSAFILAIELVGPKYRVIGGTIVASSYAIGEIVLALVAMYAPYWRTLLRIIYPPAILLICYIWFVPESIRWLLSKGKTQEAQNVLMKAAKFNGVTLSEKSMEAICHNIELDNYKKESSNEKEKTEGVITYMDAIKCPKMVLRIIVCSFWWITCTLLYYGLSLNSVSIAGNMYVNFMLVALVEIPAHITTALSLNRFGRKPSISISYLASGVACLSSMFIPEDSFWLNLASFLFGKFAITVAFTVLYVYTTELFPTQLRHSLLGTCSTIGRIGSIVAPQTPLLATIFEPLPSILFGVTAILAGVSVMAFPETLNIPLPETIDEALHMSRSKKVANVTNRT